MVGWHDQLGEHEFQEAPGVGDRQGSLACCSSWFHKESDMTEWLNWTEQKAFDCVDHNKLWKILNDMGIPDHLTASWETCMQVKKQQWEPDMEQWPGSKLGKECVKAVYCHPAYVTCMQSTSCEMLGCINQDGINIAGRNISNLQHADDTTLMAEREEELKSLLMWKKWKKRMKKLA